jgi:hypothetical protein
VALILSKIEFFFADIHFQLTSLVGTTGVFLFR